MKLDINGHKYELKQRWRDVTIREMAHAFEVLSNQHPNLIKLLTSSSDKDIDVEEGVLNKFYIDWIECFSNIPREVLEGDIVIDEPGTVSIRYLAHNILHFLNEPTKVNQVNRFKFNKKQYRLIESLKTLSGMNRLLNGATYGDWCNLTALQTALDGIDKAKYTALAQLCAVLYQPVAGNKRPETIEPRAELFMDLDCETAFAAYFFFERHINKLQRFLKTSSMEEVGKVLGSEGLISKYQGGFIGKLKLFILRKLGYLTKWD